MNVEIRQTSPDEYESLVPRLLDAEPGESALRWSLSHLGDAVYRLEVDRVLAGAATVRWSGDPREIVELAIAPERRGQGLGQPLVAWVAAEARRGKQALEVGTGNASLGNTAFYQKCEFRRERVRRDYFRYVRVLRLEHGIPVRNLLVFHPNLDAETRAPAPRRR